ncbi:TFIIS N-terminal domain-containing protein [Psidium guajava]|nr:TFIIS N-terminal domain-containing protein [Psidium guajava]
MGESLDDWREFFRTTDTDVFEFIEKAITIAVLDHPEDFLSRRGRIVERLFSCETIGARGDRAVASKESKANGDRGSAAHDVVSINDSHERVEALSDDMEDDSQVLGEVLRIKQVLDNSRHESDSALHESLRRLESMNITVDILEKTKIGVSVNSLRRNCISKQIAQLAHDITMRWKALVEVICRRTDAHPRNIGDGTSSVKNQNIRTPGQEKYDFNKAGSKNRRPNVNQHEGIAKPNTSSNTNLRTTPASKIASRKFEKREDASVARLKRISRRVQQTTCQSTGNQELERSCDRHEVSSHQEEVTRTLSKTDKRRRTVQVLDPSHLPKMAASLNLRAPQLQKLVGGG